MSTLLYAQSGGMTAVINASAVGVMRACAASGVPFLAARHGILGVLEEDLVAPGALDASVLARISRTPGGTFGSCRFDLPPFDEAPALHERLFAVLEAHEVRWLLYNGGNGSMDTVRQLHLSAQRLGYPLTVVGIPKTIDNDLLGTDFSPGYPSAAKYLATSSLEASLDLASLYVRKPRLFVMETMGRNVGWLAASTSIVQRLAPDEGPHLVLLPETPFRTETVFPRVEETLSRLGFCSLVVAEGVKDEAGRLLSMRGVEAGRYVQLGGVGLALAQRLAQEFGVKYHVAVPDYLQRAAAHWASPIDYEVADRLGEFAVETALAGISAAMVAVERQGEAPYRYRCVTVPIDTPANRERGFPPQWIDASGCGVNEDFQRWLAPLIEGTLPTPCRGGLPDVHLPAWESLPKRCAPWSAP